MTFLIFSNLFIAAAAALFTHESYYLLGADPHLSPLLGLVFAATLVVYNLDRLSDAAEEDDVAVSERHEWIRRRRPLLWGLAGTAGVGVGVSLFFVPVDVVLALVPLGAFSLAYSLPVLWGRAGPYRLKDIAGLKIFVISIVWAGATAFLPAVEVFDNPFRLEVAALVAERGIFVFAIALPFDIRDMERDRASEIWTIPLALGVDRTRQMAYGATGLFALVCLLHYGVSIEGYAVPLLVSSAVTLALLAGARRGRSEYYYLGHLDGMMALQWALVAGWAYLWGVGT